MSNVATVLKNNVVDAPANHPADLTTIRQNSLPLTLDSTAMDSMVRLAEIMSTGKATVPQEYRNNPGDCLAVVMQAVQWKMNPYAVAQKTYFVSGKIGYEAQLINAVVNSLAPTKDRIHYEWYGPWEKIIGKFEIKKSDKGEYRVPSWKLSDEEGIGIKVWATIKGEDEPRELDLLLAQARTRNSTLWADDPRQQLAYLAVKRWARLYTPDVIMGVYSEDELEEIRQPGERDMGAADVVKEKLSTSANKQRLERAPLLIDVLKLIAAAVTPEDMERASDQAGKITNKDELAEARLAWKTKLAELKGPPKKDAPINKDTGEIKDGDRDLSQDSDGAPSVNYEALLTQLHNAPSSELLDIACDLIGQIDDQDRRNTLTKAAKKRRQELEPK